MPDKGATRSSHDFFPPSITDDGCGVRGFERSSSKTWNAGGSPGSPDTAAAP